MWFVKTPTSSRPHRGRLSQRSAIIITYHLRIATCSKLRKDRVIVLVNNNVGFTPRPIGLELGAYQKSGSIQVSKLNKRRPKWVRVRSQFGACRERICYREITDGTSDGPRLHCLIVLQVSPHHRRITHSNLRTNTNTNMQLVLCRIVSGDALSTQHAGAIELQRLFRLIPYYCRAFRSQDRYSARGYVLTVFIIRAPVC